MSAIRKEIEAHILDFMRSVPKGADPVDAAKAKWSETPVSILAALGWQLTEEEEERWWESMEKTIDGEIIGRALSAGGAK